jgi:hypothetical protein
MVLKYPGPYVVVGDHGVFVGAGGESLHLQAGARFGAAEESVLRRRDGHDPGNPLDPLGEVPHQRLEPGAGVTAGLSIDRGDDQLVSRRADVGRLEALHAPKQHAGAYQEQEREGDLSHDEEPADGHLARPSAGHGSPLGTEGGGQLDPGGAKGGNHTEEHRGDQREQRGESEDPAVHVHRERDRSGAAARELEQRRAAPDRHQEAERAAPHRKEDALGEHLLDQAHSPGAERHTETHLPAARHRAGEHQVGDVGTDHQEHQSDRHHQGEQRLAVVAAVVRKALGTGLTRIGVSLRVPSIPARSAAGALSSSDRDATAEISLGPGSA